MLLLSAITTVDQAYGLLVPGNFLAAFVVGGSSPKEARGFPSSNKLESSISTVFK